MEVDRCPINVVRVEGHARAGVGGRHKRGLRRRVGGGGAAEARRTLPMPAVSSSHLSLSMAERGRWRLTEVERCRNVRSSQARAAARRGRRGS